MVLALTMDPRALSLRSCPSHLSPPSVLASSPGILMTEVSDYLRYRDYLPHGEELRPFQMNPFLIDDFLQDYFQNPGNYPGFTYRMLEFLFAEMIRQLKAMEGEGKLGWPTEGPLSKKNIYTHFFVSQEAARPGLLQNWREIPLLEATAEDRRLLGNLFPEARIRKLCTVILCHLNGVKGIEGFLVADQQQIFRHSLQDLRDESSYSENLPVAVWLSEANLRGADLETANLEGADLGHVNLEGAHLRGAKLRGANLEHAYMTHADLRGAHLERAHLYDAKLWKADLEDANLEGADLVKADLVSANLQRASLEDAKLRLANLRNANLRNANLRNADLGYAHLEGADLREADLWDVHLEGADLRGADLQETDLWEEDLEVADLGRAKLRDAQIFESQRHFFLPEQLSQMHVEPDPLAQMDGGVTAAAAVSTSL